MSPSSLEDIVSAPFGGPSCIRGGLVAAIGFLDAGFLIHEGGRLLKWERGSVQPNAEGCVDAFRRLAATRGFDLLRLYWYDGAFDPGDARAATQRVYHDAISATPGVQIRLGHLQERAPTWQHALRRAITECGWELIELEKRFAFRPQVEQKGVDTLLALDMVRLAQRRAYDMALLFSGDRDLAEAVRDSQDEGRRILLVHPANAGVATELRHLADEIIELPSAAPADGSTPGIDQMVRRSQRRQ